MVLAVPVATAVAIFVKTTLIENKKPAFWGLF